MKSKTIHRTKITSNFTTLPNRLLRETCLSFTARGILTMMLSHMEVWRASLSDIEEASGPDGEGREAVRRAIHQLEAAGYAVRRPIKNEEGKFVGVEWHWHDNPVSVELRTSPTGRKPTDGKPTGGKPPSGKPSEIRKDYEVEDNEEESTVRREKVLREAVVKTKSWKDGMSNIDEEW